MASDATSWALPSVKDRQHTGIFGTLYLVPVHISSVSSMLAGTHCCTLTLYLLADSECIVDCRQHTSGVTSRSAAMSARSVIYRMQPIR